MTLIGRRNLSGTSTKLRQSASEKVMTRIPNPSPAASLSRMSLRTVCGLDELGLHGCSGLTHVLSILDPDYPTPEVFKAFDDHDKLELRFHDAIQPSSG